MCGARDKQFLAREVCMRFRKTRPSVSGLALVGLLVLSACGPAYGQVAKAQNKKASLPAVEMDLPYADGGDQQKLDLFLPDKKGFTTIVFTYGGGWHTGSRKSVKQIGEQLQSLGYGCALLSHRLAPKDKFPAQAEDVATAFAWVKKNIEAKGGDTKRLILMGHSSGAHLSLLIATDPQYLAKHKLSPADIACVVGLSTPVDLEPRGQERARRHPDGRQRRGRVLAGHRGDESSQPDSARFQGSAAHATGRGGEGFPDAGKGCPNVCREGQGS